LSKGCGKHLGGWGVSDRLYGKYFLSKGYGRDVRGGILDNLSKGVIFTGACINDCPRVIGNIICPRGMEEMSKGVILDNLSKGVTFY
jgi:hypothetical protein